MVTEFVQYVEDGLCERISDVTVISTSDPYVVSCAELAEQAVIDRYPHIHFHRCQLDFEDIDSQERLMEFMLKIAKLLMDQIEIYKADKIYVNSAGGRKDALMALLTLCQFIPVAGVFHIVMPDVKAFNIELERIKKNIEEIGRTKDKRKYYLDNKNLFDPLMYPHRSTYSVIKIPVIPFPPSVLQKLIKTLSNDKMKISTSGLDYMHIKMLVSIGIVVSDMKYLYPTDEGRFLLKIIKIFYK
ncbi:MAG: CRISPR-associated ring nuclease [Thermoproteota archaeon]